MQRSYPAAYMQSLTDGVANQFEPLVVVPVALGFSMLALMAMSFVDFSPEKHSAREPRPTGQPLAEWPLVAIVALTSYRFYTGFLSSTWMPYLLAMEGRHLMENRQSVFMGTAKLIYGLSILLNPIFGLLGDHMAVMSHWSGRRLFLLVGVGSGGLGIYGCLVAASTDNVEWYMAATVLWMLGEAMADVTTETLVPELLPKSQYEISSNIRALNFLLGGLAGYVCLIVFRHISYDWLYYGYLLVMIACAFLTLCFINKGGAKNVQVAGTSEHRDDKANLSFKALVIQAYCAPCAYEGGFPRACLCLFIFSLGSAPMFFLLLMVRDVVGVPGQADLQLHFSCISIAFFVSAAAASILGAMIGTPSGNAGDATSEHPVEQGSVGVVEGGADQACGPPEAGAAGRATARPWESRETVIMRWRLMVASTVLFGLVVLMIPTAALVTSLTWRIVYFYIIGSAFGFSFGSVYARFQECTWSVLPPDVDIANAMGFAAMCKLAGVGIGNFVVGFILDAFSEGPEQDHHYQLIGYVIMCFFCTFVVLVAGALAHTLGKVALQTFDQTASRAQ